MCVCVCVYVCMCGCVQGTSFIAFFFGLQAMIRHIPSFSTGGVGWITDLSVTDPFWVRSLALRLSARALGLPGIAKPHHHVAIC